MNKKVLAVALALGATPLVAPAQNVTIYGRLYPEFNFNRMTGATSPTSSVSTLTARPTGENFGTIE
jgi:hypothetical protein